MQIAWKSIKIYVLLVLLAGIFITGCGRELDKTSTTPVRQESKYYSEAKAAPKKRRAEVTFNVNIQVPETARKVKLWLPYPVSDENQTVEDVKIDGNFSSNGIYRERKFGNISLYSEWENPKEDARMTLSFKVQRSEIIKKKFPEEEALIPVEMKNFLLPSTFVPVNGKVKETAINATKGKKTILSKAEALYDYVVENTERDPNIKGCGLGDVQTLINTKKGKCVDLHSIFVALARSAGVPAREILGIRIPEGKEGDMTGAYHCRAEFYLPGYGWVPIDASDVRKLMLKKNLQLDDPEVQEARSYFFGAQNENYIDFGTGRDIVLSPPQQSGELNYFMYPYAEVDGKTLDWLAQEDLKYTVTFKEF